jgi:hypothetical protein
VESNLKCSFKYDKGVEVDFIIFKEYFKLSDIVTVTDLYIFLIATMSDFYFQFFDNKRVTVILGSGTQFYMNMKFIRRT